MKPRSTFTDCRAVICSVHHAHHPQRTDFCIQAALHCADPRAAARLIRLLGRSLPTTVRRYQNLAAIYIAQLSSKLEQ
jgi:hypothetical protein